MSKGPTCCLFFIVLTLWRVLEGSVLTFYKHRALSQVIPITTLQRQDEAHFTVDKTGAPRAEVERRVSGTCRLLAEGRGLKDTSWTGVATAQSCPPLERQDPALATQAARMLALGPGSVQTIISPKEKHRATVSSGVSGIQRLPKALQSEGPVCPPAILGRSWS